MALKNSLGKVKDTAVGAARKPLGTAGKVAGAAKSTVSVGRTLAEGVAGEVVNRARGGTKQAAPDSRPPADAAPKPVKPAADPRPKATVTPIKEAAPAPSAAPAADPDAGAEQAAEPGKTQGDPLASVTPAKKPAAKKAPAKKSR